MQKKLLYNTSDVMVADPYVLEYYFNIKNSHIPLKVAGSTYAYNVYLAFSPNNLYSKEYANILSEGINT
ncbi:MAG: hypothetical protein SPLUMA2_SPLUMAMAG2_00489 [uncultured Sulfurimonas sp.]|nr:MAG: hypothetical protein SPLUMA1_SPLUMAMAG1_01205 [uncultured Sulfurimonas sp.]CAI6154597.1 MAG: hypothetical protein SPLUMA2_SPLUMAMAG2_00489 [uncultured Sulfurimonas sp.]